MLVAVAAQLLLGHPTSYKCQKDWNDILHTHTRQGARNGHQELFVLCAKRNSKRGDDGNEREDKVLNEKVVSFALPECVEQLLYCLPQCDGNDGEVGGQSKDREQDNEVRDDCWCNGVGGKEVQCVQVL